jgi:F-type H+-transporting ATPase subunit epsilon
VAVLDVRVVSPEKIVFQGPSAGVVAPAWDGQVGVLPGHAPLIALLGQGVLDIDVPGGGSHRFHVAGGVLKVEADQVTVLTEYAGDAPASDVPVGVVATPEDLLEHTSPGNPLA